MPQVLVFLIVTEIDAFHLFDDTFFPSNFCVLRHLSNLFKFQSFRQSGPRRLQGSAKGGGSRKMFWEFVVDLSHAGITWEHEMEKTSKRFRTMQLSENFSWMIGH